MEQLRLGSMCMEVRLAKPSVCLLLQAARLGKGHVRLRSPSQSKQAPLGTRLLCKTRERASKPSFAFCLEICHRKL